MFFRDRPIMMTDSRVRKPPELAGRVAVITGGGSGLGRAMARTFAGAGMAIAVLDIDEEAANQAAASLAAELGVPTTALRVDVGDAASVAAAARHVEASLGGCDVLCANVGVQQFGAIDRLTEHDWQWVVNVNVLGTVRTVREFLPLLRRRNGWRRIVLTASSSVLAPGIRMGAYQTSKFAVMGFGETLREELAPEGIGVTLLFPAGMITRHLESSAQARPANLGSTSVDPEDLTAMLAHRPMGADDVVTPEHATRNLLAELLGDAPYVLTHGSFRDVYRGRRDAMDAAFDRMETS
jgi:NAD(P)-dependent dehydrogenase (short-subunit alcohol dehydrogenase family)